MVHEVGGGLPSPRITAVSMESRACLLAGMSGLPDILKFLHLSVKRPNSLYFLIYPVLILLVLVL